MSRKFVIGLVLGLVVLGGVGAAAYFFAIQPYLANQDLIAKAESEVSERQSDLDLTLSKNKKLKEWLRRSLPADPEVAKREYDLALEKILKESGAKGYFVNPLESVAQNTRGIPFLEDDHKIKKDEKPEDYLTYTQVAFKITIPKTDLGTIEEFLKRYYSLNLLLQITLLEIKREGFLEFGDDKRGPKERADLSVEIHTKGIILKGAPVRKTLLPVPYGHGAVLGALGYTALEQSPALGRNLVPVQFENLFATPLRDYTLIAAKDIYHGTLPEPVYFKEKKEEDPVELPLPVRPDLREYVRYSSMILTSEGDEHSAIIMIKDTINNEDYEMTLTQNGEKVKAVVKKYDYTGERRNKPIRESTLIISKYTMSNKNDFTVYGLDGDALILGERPVSAKPGEVQPLPRGSKPGASPKIKWPETDPRTALLGGMGVFAPKAEKFYRWEYGKNLKQIVELSKTEADKAIRRAQSSLVAKPDVTEKKTIDVKPEAPKPTDKP